MQQHNASTMKGRSDHRDKILMNILLSSFAGVFGGRKITADVLEMFPTNFDFLHVTIMWLWLNVYLCRFFLTSYMYTHPFSCLFNCCLSKSS